MFILAMMIRGVLVQHDTACFVSLLLTTQSQYVAIVHILLDDLKSATSDGDQ